MPTMPERITAVETELRGVKSDVSEIKKDVKDIVAYINEERGAKAQRSSTERRNMAIMTGIAGLIAAAIGFAADILTPINIGGK